MSEKKEETLEENFAKIEEILADLERNDISIEDAFRKYSDGVELLKQCDESIDKVEKKVLKLMEDGKTEEFADLEKEALLFIFIMFSNLRFIWAALDEKVEEKLLDTKPLPADSTTAMAYSRRSSALSFSATHSSQASSNILPL